MLEACGSVHSLRQAMQRIDEDVVLTALRVPELACRQKVRRRRECTVPLPASEREEEEFY